MQKWQYLCWIENELTIDKYENATHEWEEVGEGGLDSRPGTTRRTRDTTVGAKLLSLPIVGQRDVAKIDEASPSKMARTRYQGLLSPEL